MIRLTVLLCLLCSLIGACTEGGREDQSVAPQTDIIAESEASIIRVETISAEETLLAEPLIASGTIAAKQTSNIGALAEGVVERIFVRVGDRVQKGDPLFRTRQIDYQRRLIEAEAMRDVAQAEVARANTLVDRYTPLAPDGVVSGVVFDDAKTALEVARANLRLSETEVETAEQALTDTIVRAPFNGSVTARYIDEGVFMSNSFSGMGNSAVVQIQECEIAAGILFAPESELARLRLGLTGRLYVDGRGDAIQSEILILNDRVDPVSRMVEIRMAFANPDCRVKAGQSVRAEVNVDQRPAIVVPRIAVRGTGDDRYIYVVSGGKVQRRVVKISDLDAGRTEVLDGLSIGEKVILSSSQPLYDGAVVEPAAS